MKKRKNKILLIISLLSLIIIIEGYISNYSRNYYCLSSTNCITVWKRNNGNCYIILGKYSNWRLPMTNYIITDNLNLGIDIIWISSNHIIVNGKNIRIINNSLNFKIENYNNNKKNNDKKFIILDNNYEKYKDNVSYIRINVKENYSIDNYGKKI